MWIEHIGTIGLVAVVVLVAAHFALHLFFKAQKKKQKKRKGKQ
ncbi:hypothetical protein [Thiomicrorhabdus xiamenensis]|nr:hypothetical protein [Thiomicrorhabdus xiamenensis]